MLHWGFAHPTVAVIAVEHPGEEPMQFALADAPNVEARVFLAYTREGLDSYDLVAYDAAGCVLEREAVEIAPGEDDKPPAQPAQTCEPAG